MPEDENSTAHEIAHEDENSTTHKTTHEGEGGEAAGEQRLFTQAELERAIAKRLARERADGRKSDADRIAALEAEVEASRVAALRARFAADVPEQLRPLLTGSTDEELTGQRDLLLAHAKQNGGNHVPGEGRENTGARPDDRLAFANFLTGTHQ